MRGVLNVKGRVNTAFKKVERPQCAATQFRTMRAATRMGAVPRPMADTAFGFGRGAAAKREKEDLDQETLAEAAAAEAKSAADNAASFAEEAEMDAAVAVDAAACHHPAEAQQAAGAAELAASEAVAAANDADAAAHRAIEAASHVTGPSHEEAVHVAAEAATAAAAAAAAAETAVDAAAVAEAVRAVQETSSEEVDVEVEPRTFQDYVDGARMFVLRAPVGKVLLAGAGLFLAATLAIAVQRTYAKYTSARAQRKRTVDRNKALVEGLNEWLPAKRDQLTPSVAQKLRRSSGFTAVEVFRKYLWYLLRERVFDQDAVADMVQLKLALGLDDAQVAEALRERAQRIYDKYGTLMLNTQGMTQLGMERKAASTSLFRKLLFLTEYPALISSADALAATDLRMIFGATDEDVERLRMDSLSNPADPMDIRRLEGLISGASSSGAGSSSASGSTASSSSEGVAAGSASEATATDSSPVEAPQQQEQATPTPTPTPPSPPPQRQQQSDKP